VSIFSSVLICVKGLAMQSTKREFHKDWWRLAGFRITEKVEAEVAGYKWVARCNASTLSFTLMVFERDLPDQDSAIGAVSDSSIANHHEHHAVTEEEAVRWFARLSTELKDQIAASPLRVFLAHETPR